MIRGGNTQPPSLPGQTSLVGARTYELERGPSAPPLGLIQQIGNIQPVGAIDTGDVQIYDYDQGAYVVGTPQTATITVMGTLSAPLITPPWFPLVDKGRVFLVAASVTHHPSGGSIRIQFSANNHIFANVSIASDQQSGYSRISAGAVPLSLGTKLQATVVGVPVTPGADLVIMYRTI